jgi:hypothetical protein
MTNLTAHHNEDTCTEGYTAGWDSACTSTLKGPDSHHDIYGCPGLSDNMMIKKSLEPETATDIPVPTQYDGDHNTPHHNCWCNFRNFLNIETGYTFEYLYH